MLLRLVNPSRIVKNVSFIVGQGDVSAQSWEAKQLRCQEWKDGTQAAKLTNKMISPQTLSEGLTFRVVIDDLYSVTRFGGPPIFTETLQIRKSKHKLRC